MDPLPSTSIWSPRFDRHREVAECGNMVAPPEGPEQPCEAVYRLAYDPKTCSMVRSVLAVEVDLAYVCESCREFIAARRNRGRRRAGGEAG